MCLQQDRTDLVHEAVLLCPPHVVFWVLLKSLSILSEGLVEAGSPAGLAEVAVHGQRVEHGRGDQDHAHCRHPVPGADMKGPFTGEWASHVFGVSVMGG